MKIKSIDQFTIADCENYLEKNPNGNEASAVVARLNYLRQQEIEYRRIEKEKLCRVNWIDIKEFLDNTKYLVGNKFSTFFKWSCVLGAVICMFLVFASLYYFNSQQGAIFYYPEDNWDGETQSLDLQVDESMSRGCVNWLELFLIEIECISEPHISVESPYSRYDYDDYDGFCDANRSYWQSKAYELLGKSYTYSLRDGFILLIIISIFLMLIVGAIYVLTSPVLRKIHNIERPSSKRKKQVLRAQGFNGRLCLCFCGMFKVKTLLPLEYDAIYPCGENAYICEKSGFKGVYNITKRQMVIPLGMHEIEICDNGEIRVISNGHSHRFTTNGYRKVN